MAEKHIIYHGSNVEVANPKILVNGFYKDFGYGFYCTNIVRQARRWALTKKGGSVVNRYNYIFDEKLNILHFDKMTEEWLDFIVNCRRGIEHNYDIIEGPMADDTIWDFVDDFADGRIEREVFWAYAKFKYPTHQIVFCTEKALKCIRFEGSENLEK
jgi:hypothetical protein